MKAKPNYNRFLVNLPVEMSDWLEEQARIQTLSGGGTVRQGGRGYVGVSDIIDQLIRAEWEREKRRKRLTKPPNCHNDILTDPDRNPDWTIAAE